VPFTFASFYFRLFFFRTLKRDNMATAPAAQVPVPVPTPTSPWDIAEPHCDCGPCYCQVLKADLLPGTFVLLEGSSDRTNTVTRPTRTVGCVVARIVAIVSLSSVSVNIFKRLNEVTGDFLYPQGLQDNHLRHLQEIVQTPELRVVDTKEIINLCFVFTLTALQDVSTLAFTCQGMTGAFFLRFRCNEGSAGPLSDVPDGCCLPFPSSYKVCEMMMFLTYV
jgi:hypothetical protein